MLRLIADGRKLAMCHSHGTATVSTVSSLVSADESDRDIHRGDARRHGPAARTRHASPAAPHAMRAGGYPSLSPLVPSLPGKLDRRTSICPEAAALCH
eukprot:2745788-Rhodomonas_salina.2